MLDDTYSIEQLADMAAVSRHTIRGYVAKGLLPTPETKGPKATYGRAVLDRLRVIRLLREETDLSLDQIRAALLALSDEQAREWAESGAKPESVVLPTSVSAAGSALDYIRRVQAMPAPSAPGAKFELQRGAPPERAFFSGARMQVAADALESVEANAPADSGESVASRAPEASSAYGRAAAGLRRMLAGQKVESRSKGEVMLRIEVTPDIDLNVRGPLTPEQHRSLLRLADHLRHLLMKGLP